MKKLLLGIITVLIVVLTGITIVQGFKIGNLNVLGIMSIKHKNDELDEKIQEATKLASADYEQKIDELNEAIKKLKEEKTNYEDMVSVSTDSEVEAANQSYENTIEFLLVRVENHAKSEGVVIDLVVAKSSSGAEDVYDLRFTARGSYVGIEEFITGIEDDSKLSYKIEEFKMTAYSEDEKGNQNSGDLVQATFICRDIKINGISTGMSNIDTIDNEQDNINSEEENVNADTTGDRTTE